LEHFKEPGPGIGGTGVKNALGMLVILVTFGLPAAAQTQLPIRVHCGGSSYTDSNGQTWQADTGFSGGNTNSTSQQIGGTADQALYQTGRYNTSGTTPLVYSFPVANGIYNVNLLFAETSSKMDYVGARVFNVKVQGKSAFPNLDIFA
jgi:malectin (di-glucose binding ER protein)